MSMETRVRLPNCDFSMQLTLNLKIQVAEISRLKTGGGGTQFPRVSPYFDPYVVQRIRGFTTMRYINRISTYVLTYLLAYLLM